MNMKHLKQYVQHFIIPLLVVTLVMPACTMVSKRPPVMGGKSYGGVVRGDRININAGYEIQVVKEHKTFTGDNVDVIDWPQGLETLVALNTSIKLSSLLKYWIIRTATGLIGIITGKTDFL
ncbi:MAG: hypothetical protein GY940_46600 [bacterium]|nr:hypothetical protein [bacterium]